ncbi:WecB/TagA/CpsF family glycosyltransferase [Bradyrhizobium sp. NAS80.1]|uniref:WecB/TagA/CpsF family glycosyltransferase n=1 Tax=Bradyrhizobium sp. NAS80.1 TaxID=1680159 RepID=UPI001FD8B344|nr:WecB/TagA/CpsF family glycosyltransferase [Bradyrhizobium sp. NAS80.1]
MVETVERARVAMRDRRRLQHVALNVAKFVNMRSDRVLRSDVIGSDIIGIDGMGIVLALRLFGVPVKERVAGIDLFWELLSICARDGFRPFLLGATPDVLNRAANAIAEHFPSIQIAGLRDGYFRPEEEPDVVAEIIDSKADCLFIAMPTPRKERFLSAYRDRLGVPFIMGIGGSLDVIGGDVRRAPQIMQSMGLEWLYRVYQEPRRMWWRYAKTNTLFAGMLIRGMLNQYAVGPRRLSRSG